MTEGAEPYEVKASSTVLNGGMRRRTVRQRALSLPNLAKALSFRKLLQPQHHAEKPVYFCLQLGTEPPQTTDNHRPFHRRQFVHP
jgi:hypothetical protein